MRFPIKIKIVALGAVLSVLVTTTALIFANFQYRDRGKENQIQTIDEQLTSLKESLNDESTGLTLNDTLQDVRTYITTQYAKFPDDPPEGATYQEQKDFYMNNFKWLYAVEGIAMYYMPPEEIDFRSDYDEFIEYLEYVKNATVSTTAYAAFLGENNTLFYIGDDCAYKGAFKTMHYLPGSRYYNFNPEFVLDGDYYDVEIDGKLNRALKYEKDGGGVTYFFVEYNFDKVNSDANSLMVVEIITLSIISVLMIIAYAFGAHFLLLRNVKKLTDSTSEFSKDMSEGKALEVKNPNVKSHDEMRMLSDSFVTLEEGILNYIEALKVETQEKERANAELSVATNIQLSALPDRSYDDDNAAIRAFIKSAKEVGGDFYDYFYLDDNRLAVVISDVSGKGIPAALFMMKSKELIKNTIKETPKLTDAIAEVNKRLVSNSKDFLFVTSFVGVIDFKKGLITYVNAGHEKPYIVSKGKVTKLDGESNFVMGGEESFVYKEETHPFNKGDFIFMFTDGLNESINSKREEFSYSRIEETLDENKDKPLHAIIDKMNEKLEAFVEGEEQFDDVTMFAVKYQENELHLSYEEKNYDIITDIADRFGETFAYLPEETKGAAGIILDELVNNLVSYEKKEDLKISVDASITKEELELKITSNGADYNPFENHKEKYLEEFHPDIKEGGFGLSIIKDLAKSYDYKYQKNHSIITIIIAIR